MNLGPTFFLIHFIFPLSLSLSFSFQSWVHTADSSKSLVTGKGLQKKPLDSTWKLEAEDSKPKPGPSRY